MATDLRKAYGEELVRLGAENSKILVFEADLSRSTFGCLFGEKYPERFFDVGIAEANMISAAAGAATAGFIPFASSFAVFATGRAYDQVRVSVCFSNLNVKICGSSAGMSDSGDGGTHQSIDDIALMQVLPNMSVFVPADAEQTRQIMRYMANTKGPMYIRVSRQLLPEIQGTDQFTPGKVYTLREGTDASIIACGSMVAKALEAAKLLEEKGISVAVANAPSIKPINRDDVLALAKCGRVVTAEEHSVIGGLGDAVSRAVEDQIAVKMARVGVQDRFGQSAYTVDELLDEYGLTSAKIADEVLRIL